MKETELNKILNYMKQYVENIYEHDSEPMLNYKDLQIVLDYITNLQEENENLKADYGSKSQVERDLLEDRINKAIEYIETHQLNFKKGITTFGSERLSMEERKLLNILKGDE